MNQRIRRFAVVLIVLYLILFAQLNFIQVGQKTTLDADARILAKPCEISTILEAIFAQAMVLLLRKR